MCRINQKAKPIKSGNRTGISLTITCELTQKPISISNKYGMYCSDLCGMQEDIAIDGKMTQLLRLVLKQA